MTDRARRPKSRVEALWRTVAFYLGIAALGGFVVALAALLLVSWLAAGRAAWARPSALPLLLWGAAAVAVAAWAWRLGREARSWNRSAAAAEIERRVGLRKGSLQGAVEQGIEQPGTSRT
ncbi:MAG TPA: hypothetical protein VLC48_04245, partial [Gemmatimonadota bacterium]|nr:hypothetical protein [Gemmatimonadota bacterium]